MLPCIQTSSPENFTAAGNNNDNMSLLERQQAMLQRLSRQQQDQWNLNSPQTTMPLYQYLNLMNSSRIHQENFPNLGFACSQVASHANLSELDHQRPSFSNVSANSCKDQHVACAKKRKAENDVEEEEEEDKKPEREAGEVIKNEKETSRKNSHSKASEMVQKTDYIHVRARRGQATDSHSLAERARREKISKKMKCLQDLVPGCNRVTGKAGMLDEIINYVQSLQKQVEFLSMKLASLNPRLDINIDNFFGKEFPAAATPIEVVHSALFQYSRGGQQEPTCSVVNTAINSTQVLPQRIETSSMLFPESYLDSVSSLCQVQQMSTLDSDWQYNVSSHY